MTETTPFDTQDAAEHQLAIRVMAMPKDANAYGDIFGGWMMAQLDIAGGIIAIRTAQGRVSTVAVNAMRFIVPVSVGDLVSVYGWVEQVGRTSIRVRVEAFAERDRDLNQLHAVATATLTYVAMDEHCRPRPVRDSGKAPC